MREFDLWLTHGSDLADRAVELLAAAGVAEDIGGQGSRIGIKPNLVLPRPASQGATTHPEIAEGVIRYLHQHGFKNLVILEGSWVGDRTEAAFAVCGYQALSAKTGVPLIDTKKDSWKNQDAAGLEIAVCDSVMALDYLINLPVMKGHCQTNITCAMKNLKGLIPDREKRRFHTLGLHKPIARLASLMPRGFTLVDAVCGDLDFEEGGNPVRRDQLIGGFDQVLVDAWVCRAMGFDLEEVPYIGMAERLGLGSANVDSARVAVLQKPGMPVSARNSRKVAQLLSRVDQREACSACCAALVFALHRLSRQGERRAAALPLSIGQGFKGRGGDMGIGSCTAGFARHVKGCPPQAADIIGFLKEQA